MLNGQYGVCFLKSRSGDPNLEAQGGRRRPLAIDKQHLRTIVEQNPGKSVREMSRIMGVRLLAISDHLGFSSFDRFQQCLNTFKQK